MKYYAYVVANVDTIKNTELLDHIWTRVMQSGIRLGGNETLLYIVDNRGEVWVFVDPREQNADEAIVNIILKTNTGTAGEFNSPSFREIRMPSYYTVVITDYRCIIKLTDELTDEQINMLSSSVIKNDYASLKKHQNEILYDQIIRVEDMPDGELKDKCLEFIKSNGWTQHQAFLITKRNGEKCMCMIPVKCRLEKGDV